MFCHGYDEVAINEMNACVGTVMLVISPMKFLSGNGKRYCIDEPRIVEIVSNRLFGLILKDLDSGEIYLQSDAMFKLL